MWVIFIGVKSPENMNNCVFSCLDWAFYIYGGCRSSSKEFLQKPKIDKPNIATGVLLFDANFPPLYLYTQALKGGRGRFSQVHSVISPLDVTKLCTLDNVLFTLHHCKSRQHFLLWKTIKKDLQIKELGLFFKSYIHCYNAIASFCFLCPLILYFLMLLSEFC